LSQEEENKEKRKKESLSTNEWLRCFFLSSLVYMNNDNEKWLLMEFVFFLRDLS